ncbi:MAG: hypothetical protein JWR18_1704 [Segetibacter sp.]|jgi:hypothetical protein|nr:hypothetical protein [Segetibacter sp.]
MDCVKLKERLESITCHIHGDAAYVTALENNTVEIETCCLLFRHQLLLMAGEQESLVVA